ncbi:malectin [Deinococcus sonorensis]|uniref:Malectin n=2 Tax=Deinococcus sonorensis TaxID=309891 RepID=A0AAU7UEF0_9DEIO
MHTRIHWPGLSMLLGLTLTLAACSGGTTPGTVVPGSLRLLNTDAVPDNGRLVFSRIGGLASPPAGQVHDRVVLRVQNTGPQAVHLTGLSVSGPWTVSPAPATGAPLTVAAGGQLDLTVRFVAEGPGPADGPLHEGSLTVVGDDSSRTTVQLAGLWQAQPEHGQEPNLDLIRRAFGYRFNVVNPGTPVGDAQGIPALNHHGAVIPDGDEVISPYWQRLDSSKPVTVTPLAAYHTPGQPVTLSWYSKGSAAVQLALTQAAPASQTLLPAAGASFTPGETFGFRVNDGEWSDPTLNAHATDLQAGCSEPCGQHLRFWPLRDAAGKLIAGSYVLAASTQAGSYDYNDSVYLIGNLKPAPVLLNVGGPTFTAPDGRVWTGDSYLTTDQSGAARTATFYTPADAPSWPKTPSTATILKTDNQQLYRTYRHNTLDTPLESRVMTYTVPLNDGIYRVRLHFAELNWNAPGKRLFNVNVEGVPVLNNFDIWKEAGGQNTALVVPLDAVKVTGGQLTVQLKATVDFPDLSGIEVER